MEERACEEERPPRTQSVAVPDDLAADAIEGEFLILSCAVAFERDVMELGAFFLEGGSGIHHLAKEGGGKGRVDVVAAVEVEDAREALEERSGEVAEARLSIEAFGAFGALWVESGVFVFGFADEAEGREKGDAGAFGGRGIEIEEGGGIASLGWFDTAELGVPDLDLAVGMEQIVDGGEKEGGAFFTEASASSERKSEGDVGEEVDSATEERHGKAQGFAFLPRRGAGVRRVEEQGAGDGLVLSQARSIGRGRRLKTIGIRAHHTHIASRDIAAVKRAAAFAQGMPQGTAQRRTQKER